MKQTLHQDTIKMGRVFGLAIEELEAVLDRKKAPTDLTKIAMVTASTYSRIKSAEIHEKALELMMKKWGEDIPKRIKN